MTIVWSRGGESLRLKLHGWRPGGGGYDGQIFSVFVIMLAAAEAAIGLAIVLGIYRQFETIDVEATDTLRG